MQRFTIPRDVYFGANALDHLKDIKGTKAILVIGSERLIKDGTVPKIQDLLKEAQIETTVFSNAILGIVHSMAHKSGKIFNIPHGCANAIYLSYVIEFNAKTAGDAYADIAKRLGLSGNTTDELVKSLIKLVKDFRIAMNMPTTLKEFGVSEEDFKSNLDKISEGAVADPCTGTNPREISVEEMKKLFEATYFRSFLFSTRIRKFCTQKYKKRVNITNKNEK